MKRTLNFNGKSINLECNAATPLVGKRIFNFDFIQFFQESSEISNSDRIEKMERVVYTMAMQAECGTKAAMAKTEDDFIEWLVSFDFDEIVQCLLQPALELWQGTQKPTSVQKKEGGPQ